MSNNALIINPRDNVAVAVVEIKAGSEVTGLSEPLQAVTDVPRNHKVALTEIKAGDAVIKYGETIGRADKDVRAGEWVHTHNLKAEGS